MFWKKKPIISSEEALKPPAEVIAHKKALRAEVKEVTKAAEKVDKVFGRNHFTAKLFIAAGGPKR